VVDGYVVLAPPTDPLARGARLVRNGGATNARRDGAPTGTSLRAAGAEDSAAPRLLFSPRPRQAKLDSQTPMSRPGAAGAAPVRWV